MFILISIIQLNVKVIIEKEKSLRIEFEKCYRDILIS